ncbi:MAG: hypothetical protein AAF937_04665 [Planctomycetota bacterium]
MMVSQGQDIGTKPESQAEVRPIWGGFMGPPAETQNRSAREPVRIGRPLPSQSPEPGRQAPLQRVGTLDSPQPPQAQPGTVVLGLNSRAAATFVGFAAVAAFVLVVFLGSTIGISPSAASATHTPHAPHDRTPASHGDAVTWSGGQALTSLSVAEYGEQVAIATLTSSLHQVSTEAVTFYADPDRSGNALQQFSEVFGEAIATGRNPLHGDQGPRPAAAQVHGPTPETRPGLVHDSTAGTRSDEGSER